MAKKYSWLLLSSLLIFFGCRNQDRRIETPDAEHIYLDYRISGEEGYDKLTIVARFLVGGKNGESIFLDSPSKIELDGEVMPSDSSAMTGFFYELNKGIGEFSGKHEFVFTEPDGQKHRQTFRFHPMTLRNSPPDTLTRSELVFELAGVEEEDFVRVLMTDTAAFNEGMDRLDTVRNGRLILRPEDLAEVANGPVTLELINERDESIREGEHTRGKLHIYYRIRRSFFLKD